LFLIHLLTFLLILLLLLQDFLLLVFLHSNLFSILEGIAVYSCFSSLPDCFLNVNCILHPIIPIFCSYFSYFISSPCFFELVGFLLADFSEFLLISYFLLLFCSIL
jgi:hypothetical protein